MSEDVKKEDLIEESETKKKKKSPSKKQMEEIEELEKEIKSLKEQLLLEKAETENFKRRMTKELVNIRKYAAKDFVEQLLFPIDSLKKAVSMETEDKTLKNFLIGFQMINNQIFQLLEAEGVMEIESLGKEFDPTMHYAVEKTSILEKENGVILEVIQTGYKFKDQLIRPAMVKVNEWSEENGKDK